MISTLSSHRLPKRSYSKKSGGWSQERHFIAWDEKSAIMVNQSHCWVGTSYIQEMVDEFSLDKAKSPRTTGSHQIEPHDAYHNTDEDSYDQHNYRSIVGKLQWLTGCRPDIQHAGKGLASDSNNVRPSSWKKGKRLIKYLKGTSQHMLVFRQVTS